MEMSIENISMVTEKFNSNIISSIISGIYKITCIKNGKIYIGSTCNFQKRKYKHLADLRINKHTSKKLQNSFNKHGENNFLFEMIEFCEPIKEILIEREQYYLDLLKPYDREIGFNNLPNAYSILGFKHPKEDYEKRRIQRSAGYGRKFEIISPSGEIFIGKGISKFADDHKLPSYSIYQLLDKKINQFKGWHLQNSISKKYKFLNPNKELIIINFGTLSKFCEENELHYNSMLKLERESIESYKGWKKAN